jgi:hypothetical protein
MRRGDLVLCAGMHRSGTSLTASLLEPLGVRLPGELIAADAANPTGYFENRSIVEAQEQLLQALGYWWPTERASRGMPASVVLQSVYGDYVDWLTAYLDELLSGGAGQIAVKDPRTSLLMPAWHQAAARLEVNLRVVICVREPRDVCWSLVWRDGPSVGMTWARAQRLWMEHYKALIRGLGGAPAQVVLYEHWLEPHLAEAQLAALAAFLGRSCTAEQRRAALVRVRPEFNHGGVHHLPPVDRSLRRLHAGLGKSASDPASLVRQVDRCAAALERQRLRRAFCERLHLVWLQTPWGRRALGAAWDPATLREQLGTTSLRAYRRVFREHPDLRPHPLISPAHLNRERLRRGLPPLQSASDLFRHLLYPDLLPLDPHPWFDCRHYQIQTGQLGLHGPHPVLSYLSRSSLQQPSPFPNPTFPVPWLIALGAHRDWSHQDHLPEFSARLHPGLVLADPLDALGDPADGREQLIANEQYWRDIQALFELWPDSDPAGPLGWLSEQPNVGEIGLTEQPPATGYQLWWLAGHWEARLLAELAGVEINQSRLFFRPEDLYEELLSMRTSEGARRVLVALTAPLLELFLVDPAALPAGLGVLNLVWPRPSQQSPWLHLLAQTSLVVECRAEVRAYLQGLGFKAEWPRPTRNHSGSDQLDAPTLLLALTSGPAEAQLAAAAPSLNADRYDAILRLDAELQLRDPVVWLEEQLSSHGSWLWLNPLSPAGDPKGHALVAWANQRGVTLRLLADPPEPAWWSGLSQ